MHRANDLANFHRARLCVFTVCAYTHTGRACGEFDCNKVTKYVDYAQASRHSFDLWYAGRQIGRRGPFCSPPLFFCATSLWGFLSLL